MGVYPPSFAPADFDGDGALALAVPVYPDSRVQVLRNSGGGAFAAPVAYDMGLRPSPIVAADFDGDGWMAAHYDPSESTSGLLDRWRAVRRGYTADVEAAARAAWSRTGRQSYWGERTLQWWIERAVEHGEDHRRQMLGE